MIKVYVFIIDAFSYSYIIKYQDLMNTSLFQNFDVSQPLTTILGYSSGIFPSIWSGKKPDETNLWNEYTLDLLKRHEFKYFVNNEIENDFIRKILFNYWKIFNSKFIGRKKPYASIPRYFRRYFNHNDFNFKNFPEVNNFDTIDQLLNKKGFKTIYIYEKTLQSNYWKNILKNSNKNLNVIYSSQLDELGHRLGPDNKKILKMASITIEIINSFIEKLEKDNAHVIVFSDHGMLKVNKKINIMGFFQQNEEFKSLLYFINSTIVQLWPNKTQRMILKNVCKRINLEYISKEDSKEYGLNFKDERFGTDFIVAKQGIVFSPNFISGVFTPRGMHGYLPQEKRNYGIWCYWGKKSMLADKVSSILDIFSFISKLFID